MSFDHKLLYVFLWPLVIIADLPFFPKGRPLLRWLVRNSKRETRKDIFDGFGSSPYAVTAFLRGFIVVLLVVLLFLLGNANWS